MRKKNQANRPADPPGKPVKTFRIGAVQASVFMNVVEKDGERDRIPSISFQKRYTDDKGEWQTTNRLNLNDIPKAVMVLQEAYRWLALKTPEA